MEARLLRRIAAVMATANEKKVLHKALLERYRQDPSFVFHEVSIPLEGFYWLDFDVDAQTFKGMCCRGWTEAVRTLPQVLGTSQNLNSNNPYR